MQDSSPIVALVSVQPHLDRAIARHFDLAS